MAITIFISWSFSAPSRKSFDELPITPIPNIIIIKDIAVEARNSRRCNNVSFSDDVFPGIKNLHNTTTELKKSYCFGFFYNRDGTRTKGDSTDTTKEGVWVLRNHPLIHPLSPHPCHKWSSSSHSRWRRGLHSSIVIHVPQYFLIQRLMLRMIRSTCSRQFQ